MNELAPTAAGPACIGIILDGNRRWAKAHSRPVFDGHSEGHKKLEEVIRWAKEAGVPNVVAYAFSAENWHRPEDEVGYLMKLFRSVLENEMEKMQKERVRVRFIGDRSKFDGDMQKMMEKMETHTAVDYDITLHLAMSYGGRAEIVAAAKALIGEEATEISEAAFAHNLWSYPMPDPDLIIRTGGEKRLSGFLPWQSVYSELFFSDTLWPDFSREEFDAILAQYATRERRHGK